MKSSLVLNRKVEERIVMQRAVGTLGSQPFNALASEGRRLSLKILETKTPGF